MWVEESPREGGKTLKEEEEEHQETETTKGHPHNHATGEGSSHRHRHRMGLKDAVEATEGRLLRHRPHPTVRVHRNLPYSANSLSMMKRKSTI